MFPTENNPTDQTQGDGASMAESALDAVATEPAAMQTDATTAEAAGLSLRGAPDDAGDDFLPLNGTDHVHFWVGNARQAAYYYSAAFGFRITAYRGPETGCRETASYLLTQDKIRFVFTTAIRSDHEVALHVAKHGDGVKDIAIWVDDATKSYEEVTKRGATAVKAPETIEDEHGRVVLSTMGTYGDTVHTFVERKDYTGVFLPGFVAVENPNWAPKPSGLKFVDHCVGNVHLGDMDKFVEYYSETMGFRNLLHFSDEDITTEYSSLMSKVMSSGNERIKFPINEPAVGQKRSQIDEYLDFYNGAGVQHIALATDDILKTVAELRSRGIEFLSTPTSYYEQLQARVGTIDEPVDELAKLGILVDRDPDGYLLQIFTRPVEDRPTVFFEIIQRKGARTFGEGNFKALFQAIEREQERRGNL